MYYYTVCYFTCIFYAVVRQISMLFIDNKDSVFCTHHQPSQHEDLVDKRLHVAVGVEDCLQCHQRIDCGAHWEVLSVQDRVP